MSYHHHYINPFTPGPRQSSQSVNAGDLGQLFFSIKSSFICQILHNRHIIIYNIYGKNLYMANIINRPFRIDEQSRQIRPNRPIGHWSLKADLPALGQSHSRPQMRYPGVNGLKHWYMVVQYLFLYSFHHSFITLLTMGEMTSKYR